MKKLLCLLACALMISNAAFAGLLPAEGIDTAFQAWTGIEAKRAVVLCESLTGRDAPNGKAVKTFKNGETFLTWETDGGWINAYYSDGAEPCWVRGEYVAIDPAWYVTTEETPAYAFPGGETRVALLDAGEKLPVLLSEGGYCLVGLRGAAAWLENAQDAFAAERLRNLTDAVLYYGASAYTIAPQNLAALGEMLASVEYRGEKMAGCPFGQTSLALTLADGGSVTLDLAADDCCIYRVDGRHDYAYARNLFTAEGAAKNDALLALFGLCRTE